MGLKGQTQLLEILFVEFRQLRPGSFRSCLVINLAATNGPSVITAIENLDGSLQVGRREGLFQLILCRRVTLVVVVRHAAQHLSLHLRN